jgi:hypothetical protein
MSKRQRRTVIEGQFAPRLIEMLRSPAMSALSLSARRAMDRIEIELADHGGTDNGKLPVTYDDFETFGIHRHAIAPAINELVALGFVEVTELGRAGNAEFRSPSKYRHTYRAANRANPTHEWRRIHTIDEAEAIAVTARKTPRAQKQKSSGEKRQVSVAENTTKNRGRPVPETATTCLSAETTTTLDILGRGGRYGKGCGTLRRVDLEGREWRAASTAWHPVPVERSAA